MKSAVLVLLFLAACGGKTSGPTERPAPGSSECEPSSGCTLCSDELWHCAGATADAGLPACEGTSCGKGGCVLCPAGSTDGTLCNEILNPGGDNDVDVTGVHVVCSQ